ncbi:MAG: hypothetical protein BWY81_00025 [Firmicutes bacterium ADurb.Bin467]|nr:MAG: hypothetical protein BWY81_00025 [Firmicutes bacterium ADurb.Bin467]
MFNIVRLLSSIAVGTSIRSERINTMSADSIATSVPEPIAMPMSACASAGASLMPSPTIATLRPSSWSFLTSCDLSSGNTSESTRSMPTCLAIAAAVFALSPVIIATSMPILCRLSIAKRLDGFTTSATATMPAILPSTATYIGVLPSPASRSESCSSEESDIARSSISFRLPASTDFSPIFASMPRPAIASNRSTFKNSGSFCCAH